MTTSGSQQVVFIDSRVSDIQDLLNGVQPGDLVFVLDPNSDGVQQIADILAANHLTDLAAIAIVGHGAAGSIDLGSSVVTDANLSSYADALAKIGASLTASGDLQLYACDVASGATGATFIADLAALTGADVAAATHLVGSADLGGSWTLDASTGPIEAGTPFTQAALDNFQGDLVALTVTGQLWVGGGGTGVGNPDGHSDFRVYHSDSDGLADDRIIAKELAPTGLWQAVGLDTSANLFFALDNSYHFTVNNLTTGAQLTSTTVASTADQDVFNNFVVDPRNNIIYADLFGYDYLDNNPGIYSATLHGGDLLKFTYNQSTGAITPAYTFNDAGPSHTINNNDVLIDSGTTSGATRYADGRSFWLSPDGSTLYYVDDNDNDPGAFWGFSTNAILKVSTTGSVGTGDAPTPVLLSSQAQFPVNDSNGYITALTVDSADGIIYFTTSDGGNGANASQNGIWWMPIAGGTATKMTLPGGVTFYSPSFFGQNITFDPNARVLYVADQGDAATINGHIIKLTLSGDGHSFTSGVNDFAQADTNGIADGWKPYSIIFDALPNLSVAGTTNHAGEQGANINLDTSVTLSDDQGRLASFSVQITGGTFSSNETSNNDDHLSVNGQISGALGGALSGITVSWNSATETLTLSGDDTVAHYQTAVSEIQYNTTGDNPTNYGANTTRTITWIASDGVTITHPDASDPNQQSTTIAIDAVNDAPVATITPASYSATEQVNLSLKNNGLSVSDVDGGAAGQTESVTLSVTEGTLTIGAGTSGVIVTNSGTSLVTLQGTVAQLNDLLNTNGTSTVVYNDPSDTPAASATLTLQINDAGNTGSGGALTGQDTATINITAVNDAPNASMTTDPYTATEQTALNLKNTGMTVSDVDALGAVEFVTLSVTEGVITVTNGTSGVIVTNSGTSLVTLQGTLAQLNDLLNTNGTSTVSYIDNTDNPSASATLTLQINDGGATGSGGAQTGSDTSTINITAVNDAPVATITPTSYSATEQVNLSLKNNGLSVSDVDGNAGNETVTLSVTEGTLTIGTGTSGVIVDSGNGTSSVVFHGTIAQLNDLLNTNGTSTVVYNDPSDTPAASSTLTLLIHDNGNTGGGDLSNQDTATINIAAVNDAPNASMTTDPYTATEQTALNLKNTGMSVSDVDALGASETATLSVTEGTLTVTAGGSGAVVSNSGTNSVTITGTLAQINALLNTDGTSTVSYIDNTDNPSASANLTLQINDNGNTGSGGAQTGSDTSTINITAVNDAPVSTITPTSYSGQPNVAINLKNNGLSVSDVDGNAGSETVTLSVAPDGVLTVTAGTSGAGVAGSGTSSVTITGTIAQINALLNTDGTSTVSFTDSNGGTKTLTLLIHDNGNTGGGDLSAQDTASIILDNPPVVANAGNTVAYTEQQTSPTAILVDSAITVTDSDSATLSGATVKITGGVVAGDVLAAVTTGTAIIAVWNGTDTLTLSGTDTPVDYQAVLRSVTFTTPSDDPTNGGANLSRTITWTVTDDLGASSAPGTTTTINVTAVNDGPSAIITPASYAATEGVSLSLKNNGLAVSDVDGNTGSETVTLSVGPEGILNVTPGTSGALVSNSGTATVTIAGTAAQINALLNTDGTSTVAYIDNNDNPVSSATLTLAINDNGHTGGGNLTSSDLATINITAVNDPPVFTNLGGAPPTFTENGSSVIIDNDVTVSDPELQASPNKYAGATLTLARTGGANADDAFAGTGSLDLVDSNGLGENVSLDGGSTFIGTYSNPGDGSISFTFNANAAAADINSVMHQIIYANASDNPPASVQIDWTFSDGNGQPGGQAQGSGPTPGVATGSSTVTITQVDDPPALLNVAVAASYVPGSPGVVLSPALQAFDPDAAPPSPNPGLVSATITIATGFLAGDELFVNLPTSGGFFVVDDGNGGFVTTNIKVTSNAGGQLVLGGLDSVFDYRQVLEAVSYHSTAADPTNGGTDFTRTITWKVSDGALDNQAPSPPLYPETTLGINQPPTVDLDGSTGGTGYVTSFTENGAPLAIANANASVTDPDDATISSATIVLTNAKPGDALSIVGALPAGINSSIDTSVPGQITIHLTGQTPVADYQTAVGQIRFVNTSDNPNTTDRDITVQVSNVEDSNVAHATVHVIPVNDAPVLANVAAGAAAPPGSGPVTLSPALTVSDVDNTTLASATVAITAGTFAGDGDVLSANVAGTSIVGVYSVATETLTLSGTDTLAHYQQVLESVTFNSTSPNPTNGGVNPTRTVSWQVNDGSGSNNLSAVATTKIQIASPRNDFNGDQISDLLLQNAALGNTSVMIDLMNGVAITSSATIPNFTNLQVKATGDFNHDNKADIVLQASDGTPQIWFMNGTTVASTTSLSNPGASWHIIATGDFNHDGNTDILWQDNNGTAAFWLMNGTTLIGGGAPTNPGASWHVIGAGDFNSDGNSDVLWQNNNGTPAIWEMNGATIIGGGAMTNPGVAWHAISTGDFNGDGKADILWQNDNGTPAIWLMDGTTIIGGGAMTNPGIAWHAIGTSDFNADGKSDILWQNNDGTPAIWEMDGTTIIGGGVVSNPGPTWHLKDDGPIVFDAAAASAATGAASVSTLPGSALLSSNSTNLFGDPTNLPGSGSPSSSPTSSNFFGNPTNPAGSGPPSPGPTSGNFFGIPTNLPGSGQAPAAIFHSAPDTVGGNMHLSAPDSLVADTNGLGAGNFLPKTLGQST